MADCQPVAQGKRSRYVASVRVGVVLLAMLAAAMSPQFVAAVVGSCNPGRSHDAAARHVGTLGAVSGINGLSANVLELNPYYTGNNPTGTNATIMLTTTDISKWAQLGMYKSKLQAPPQIRRQAGIEFYLSPSQNYYTWFGAQTVQTQTWYEILEDSGNFDFFIAGSYVARYSGFTPSEYQLFGETHDLADQMPGVSSNVETFRGATYFTGVNHGSSHTVTSSTFNEGTSFYGVQNLGGGTYYVWDRCGTFSAAVDEPTLALSSPAALTPWASPSGILSTDDVSVFGILSAVDVTGQAMPATPSTGWDLSQEQVMSSAAAQLDVGAESRVYRALVRRSPRAMAEPAWVVTSPGGIPPFDGPVGGPPVFAPRLSGVILDPATGELLQGFMH